MSVWIYSIESWPGTVEHGRNAEYIQVLGHQIGPVFEREWFQLKNRYGQPYHRDYIDAAGPLHFNWHTAEEIVTGQIDTVDPKGNPIVAQEMGILQKYGHLGVVTLRSSDGAFLNADREGNDVLKRRMEKQAEASHQRWMKEVTEVFMAIRREKISGGIGRLLPTRFERYCFETLAIPVPDTVEEIREKHAPVNVTVQVTPQMIADAKPKEVPHV